MPRPTTTTTPKPATARDRVALYGPDRTDVVDLLAAILPGRDAAARAAIIAAGGLASLGSLDVENPAIAPADRVIVAAAVELGRRIARQALPWGTSLRGPDDVVRFCRAQWGDSPVEVFAAIGIDARARVRLIREISRGSVSHVDVHPREVFRPMIAAGISSVIVCHNHPSGDHDPSAADVELTRRLTECGRMIGVPVLDHVVVSRSGHASLAAMGICLGVA